VIEHNLDVICQADQIIDMGPEGGSSGGEIIATGTPEEIMEHETSVTGRYLRNVFSRAGPQTACREMSPG
jgi:excinuclease ABC subunit A